MSNVHKPADAGKDTDPSITTHDDDVLDFLEDFKLYLEENLPKVRAACARFDARIKAEREATDEDDAPDTDEEPHVPGLALLSDGRAALSLVNLDGADLTGRTLWTGIILTEAETSDALEFITDAADEAAGRVAHRILFGARKDEDEGGEGSAL
jgi:hypothetical protein